MTVSATPETSPEARDAERPFPLAQSYRRRVLPLIALFIVSLVIMTALSMRHAVRDIYLDFAARRVDEIADEVSYKRQGEWGALLDGTADADTLARLSSTVHEAVEERGLPQLKIYDSSGKAIFSTDVADLGKFEDNEALSGAIREGEHVLVPHEEADGTRYNEFYIPVKRRDGKVGLVMELYEPAGHLREIMSQALVLPTVVSGLLLAGLLVMLSFLIRRAQAGINLRAALVRELTARLESFVSSSAIGAVRATPHGGHVPLKRIELSLLYSDVRRFTDFSETRTPEEVAAFLDSVMTLQIECVARHGGDVDKLIGDAVLARFEGPGKEKRAVAAALDIQAIVEATELPRGVGVGVYTGQAISGPIGPEARRDYTVVGDAVNIAARLCTAAAQGEIVADAETVARTDSADRFGPAEAIKVKGREQPIEVRRCATSPPLGSMSQAAFGRAGARRPDPCCVIASAAPCRSSPCACC